MNCGDVNWSICEKEPGTALLTFDYYFHFFFLLKTMNGLSIYFHSIN